MYFYGTNRPPVKESPPPDLDLANGLLPVPPGTGPCFVACAGDEAVEVALDVEWLVSKLAADIEGDLAVWHRGGDPWAPTWRLVAVLRPLPGGKANCLWL